MRRTALLLLLIFAVLAADQWTKSLVRAELESTDEPLRIGALTLIYAENRGAFLSFGSDLPRRWRVTIFDGVVAFALAVGALVLFQGLVPANSDQLAVALLLGGGTGNLIDRLRFRGQVTDFAVLSFGPLQTGVFNVADVAITVAVLWLMLSWMLDRIHRVHS